MSKRCSQNRKYGREIIIICSTIILLCVGIIGYLQYNNSYSNQ